MLYVPGMFLENTVSGQKAKLLYAGSTLVILLETAEWIGVSQYDVEFWKLTGEIDWSLVPDGTAIEINLTGGRWTKGIKIGSKNDLVFTSYPVWDDVSKENRLWASLCNVRIPQPPIKHKEKFWVNIYSEENRRYLHSNREEADKLAECHRVACIEREIEWEEGEGL